MLVNKSSAKEFRADKFTWQPADVKIQDEHGSWINGEDFLNRK